MGCSSERAEEGNKKKNGGYPVCRLTIPLTEEIAKHDLEYRGLLIP